MHNLEINKNELNVQITLKKNSKLEAKKISRRLFIEISLMSLSVLSSIDNFKANKKELNKEISSKKVKLVAEAASDREGSDKPSAKGNSDSNGSDPGGSDKPSPKGTSSSQGGATRGSIKPSSKGKSGQAKLSAPAPAPKGGSRNPGGKG